MGRAPPVRLTVLKVAVVRAAEVDATLDLRRVLLPPLLGRRDKRSCFLLCSYVIRKAVLAGALWFGWATATLLFCCATAVG